MGRASKVARQLDFGCEAAPPAVATLPTPARAAAVPETRPSVKDACTSPARFHCGQSSSPRGGETVGSVASQSREISSPGLREFSPLRSWSTHDSSSLLHRSRSAIDFVAPETMPRSLLSGDGLPAALEGISVDETPDGGTVLHVHLRGCACNTGQIASGVAGLAPCACSSQLLQATDACAQLSGRAADSAAGRNKGGAAYAGGVVSSVARRGRGTQTHSASAVPRRRHRHREHVNSQNAGQPASGGVPRRPRRSKSASGAFSGSTFQAPLASYGASPLALVEPAQTQASLRNLRNGFGAMRARYLDDVMRFQLRP